LSGRGLCDELITRPEESYRLCCVIVCDLETSRTGAPYIYIYIYDISRLRVKTTIVHRNTTGRQDYQTATLHFPARAATGAYRMRVALWVRGCFTWVVGVSWETWIHGWTEYVKPEPWIAATPVSVSENLQFLYCAVAHLSKYFPNYTKPKHSPPLSINTLRNFLTTCVYLLLYTQRPQHVNSWREHHLGWRSTFIRGALRATRGQTYELTTLPVPKWVPMCVAVVVPRKMRGRWKRVIYICGQMALKVMPCCVAMFCCLEVWSVPVLIFEY